MSFGIPVRNGLGIGLLPSTAISTLRIGGRPALLLNFIGTTTLDSRITFTRGSNATLVDSTGKITYAPANFFTFSEQFDNAAWSKTNTTVTANSTTAPNGTLTADTLTATAGTAISVRVGQSGTTNTAITYVTSFYVRPGTHTFVQIHINAQSADWVNFTLTGSGTVQNNGAAVGAISFDSATGYYRISATYTAGSTDRTPFFGIVPSGTATRNQTWNPTGTETVFVWGAQFEPVTYQTTPGTYNATTTAAYYGPRFDYDPATLAPKGLLIEEQRTNLLLQTSDFTAASWAAAVAGTSTRTNNGTALGFMSATVTATSANGGIRQVLTGLTAAQVYTLSFYIQSAATSVRVRLENSILSYGAFITVIINPSNGTASAPSGFTSVTATPFGAGYLYKLTLPAAGGTLIANLEWNITASGDTMQLGMPQFEAGAFATSYIPTVAAAVTRSPDVATMTGTNFSSWYNATQGTFVSQFTPTTISGTRAVLDANDNTANESIRLQTVSADPFFTVTDGGVDQASIDAGTVAANTNYKIAAAYEVNNFAVSLGGGTVGTDTSGTLPTVTQMQIGNSAGGNRLNGYIRQISYYNTRLTNTTLQALSI